MPPFGQQVPMLHTPVPGPVAQAFVDTLARHECPAVTARRARRAATLGAASDDPIVWDTACGANVRDVDGNVFVDLTAGFAVNLLGHRDPRVVAAVHAQADRLLHAMGDAFPDRTRIDLLARLAAIAPHDTLGAPLDVALLGLSGSDAIDAAVRTARLATGRAGVLVFEGGYHGLALGVLGLQAYKASFTDPFRDTTHPFATALPWGADPDVIDAVLADGAIGLVLVEPVQGRGGMRAPPPGWLGMLRAHAHAHGALFALDEIQTGLGRTGALWAGPADGADPDLLCLGKALGGGLPLSACLGTRRVMDAWGASRGEALATQTFLGHPLGCAAALAVLDAVATDDVPARASALGVRLRDAMRARGFDTTGRGAMVGVVLGARSLAVARALLQRGFLVLPAGRDAEVLALTPPLALTDGQLDAFADALAEVA